MNYDPSGSGAYMGDDVNSMINYFGYSATTQLYYRSGYNDNDWANMIKANLDNKMPVQYADVCAALCQPPGQVIRAGQCSRTGRAFF